MTSTEIDHNLSTDEYFTANTSIENIYTNYGIIDNERTKKTLNKKNISKNNLISKYNSKLIELIAMKKDLAEKQKPMIDLYKTILSLRKEISKAQGKVLPVEEIKILSYPLEDQFLQSKGDNIESSEPGHEIIKLKNKFQHLLNFFIEICHKLTNEKCKIFEKVFSGDFDINEENIKKKLDECKEELHKLDQYADNELKRAENALQSLLQETHFLIIQGDISSESMQELETKLQTCETRLKEALTYLEDQKDNRKEETTRANRKEKDVQEMNVQLQNMQKSLDEEKTLVASFKKRQDLCEETLRATKEDVRSTRLKKQELESKVGELSNYVRNMEYEWQAKELELCERFEELQNAFQMQELYIKKLEVRSRKRNAKLLFSITLHIMYDVLYPEIYFLYQ